MSTSVRDLRSLSKRETQLMTSLESTEKFINDYDAEKDGRQLSVRVAVLESIYKEFYEVRGNIELLLEDVDVLVDQQGDDKQGDDKQGDEQKVETADERSQRNRQLLCDFEERYCIAKAVLLEMLEEKKDAKKSTQAGPSFSKIKLPEIRLPTFNGKLSEWVTFRDSFKSLIHENTQLTDMDRFSYLRSGLSGEALQEIDSIEPSAANYAVAWKALEDRYENKKLIVKAHLDTLFAAENLKRENYEGLSQLISVFDKNLQMLDKIGEKTSEWSTVLAYMVCSKLDPTSLRHWESHHNSNEVPKYANLIKFLKSQCSVLQSIAVKPSGADQRTNRSSVCHTAVKFSKKCLFCGEAWHPVFQCVKFQRMKVEERNEAVFKNRLCRNCLQGGHYARMCDKGECRHCRQKHHSMLHMDQARSSVPPSQSRPPTPNQQQRQPQSRPPHPNQQQTRTANTANSQNSNTQTATEHATTSSQALVTLPITTTHNVILSTAQVKIKDRLGNSVLARALLDSCSQHCLMTKSFSTKLNFSESPTYLCVQGIGSSQAVATKLVSAIVGPRSENISPFAEEMQFYVLPTLTVSLPTTKIRTRTWCLPESSYLADPHFNEPGPIDIIIGAEFYLELLKDERQKATDEGPTLQNTVFGWVVSGRIPDQVVGFSQSAVYVCSTAEIQDQLTRFWELETCHSASTQSVEESRCEEFFDRTTVRNAEGRFVVTLPKKESVIQQLGESKATALKRFLGMERRFAGNPELKRQYSDFIHEYLNLGHMREHVGDDTASRSYYLPHHAVLKPDSTTTKLRVVFDASCKTATGVSLNDGLMVGPVVQDELLSIILRFRLNRYALVADIAKMYRMVQVQPTDYPLQRILWRDNPSEPIRTFELTTVTYGTASAPYLATKCLQRLSEDGEKTHPAAAKVVGKSFYVDDMLSGVDEIPEGKVLIHEIIGLMRSAGLDLRKWNSNSRELLLEVPADLRDERSILELDSSSSTVKTLGLTWEPGTDNFRFSVPKWNTATEHTKRSVVSDASRLFDPLGLVGPVVVQAKIFLQELWKQECGWDEPLSAEMQEQWMEYRRNLVGLDSLSIPRWVGVTRSAVAVEIHGFCDASEKAYGACVYVRTIAEDGKIAVQLLTAKSRVAPLDSVKKGKKSQSIPRLELSSALLLAHLYEKVKNSINVPARSFFWTDSMIVLCWLSSSPSRWKQFVANRVSEIQHVTQDGEWNHVAGTEDPADIISRGMTPAQLQYQTVWFQGPYWLLLEEAYWPRTNHTDEVIEPFVLEEKGVTVALPTITPNRIFGLHSSMSVLVGAVAYCRRFVWNARPENRSSRREGVLSVAERDEALKVLVRLSQQESFPQEIADLSKGRQVRESSKIVSLNPQLHEGILRVGGRLRNAVVADGRRHPYILDHRHPFATTVVRHYHRKLLHAGQQQLVATVREQFWPTNVRNLARQVIHRCVDCFRVKPRVQEQLMADLPPERVTPCVPFQRVGVDYCGPFSITYPQRKCKPIKCFVAVFVCLVTKAVHLELAADLSTQAFIGALTRFCSYRGTPSLIMCDNGRNFVGARRHLDELCRQFQNQQFEEEILREAANNRIEFKFIPARSPNFGGLWESAVKSFKNLFKRTIGTRSLVHDHMLTFLAQAEAILNSRPLTPVSNDPNDFEALTPGHFIIHRPLTAIPQPDLSGIPENRLTAWQRLQADMQRLWKQWSEQYLSNLHNRTKWTRKRDNVRVGTMVVLKEENLPPLKWLLARVTDVHTGSDGNVRVVTVRTKDGSYKRAISKVCVLPIQDNEVLPDGEN